MAPAVGSGGPRTHGHHPHHHITRGAAAMQVDTHQAPTRCTECQYSVSTRLPPMRMRLGICTGGDPEALDTCQGRSSRCWSATLNQNQDLSAGSQTGRLRTPALSRSPREWTPSSSTLSTAPQASPPALASAGFIRAPEIHCWGPMECRSAGRNDGTVLQPRLFLDRHTTSLWQPSQTLTARMPTSPQVSCVLP